MNKIFLYLAALCFLLLSHSQVAFCEDDAGDLGDDDSPALSDTGDVSSDDGDLADAESPTFKNPAQAAHAANLAEAAAAGPGEVTADAQQFVIDQLFDGKRVVDLHKVEVVGTEASLFVRIGGRVASHLGGANHRTEKDVSLAIGLRALLGRRHADHRSSIADPFGDLLRGDDRCSCASA